MRQKERETERISLREKLCHALDIQPDKFPGGTLVEIRGKNSVTVKGGGSITLYTEEEIRLSAKGGEICVRGRRLCCSAYCRGTTVIDGYITSVELEEGRE